MLIHPPEHPETTHRALRSAFPVSLHADLEEVMNKLPPALATPSGVNAVLISEGCVNIPYRIYLPPRNPESLSIFTAQQTAILAAIYCLNPSGYQREDWGRVLSSHPSLWAAPFIALLLADYVPQIPAMLLSELNPEWDQPIKEFGRLNPDRVARLNSQVATYWGEDSILKIHPDPPAFQLLRRFNLWDRRCCRRKLLRVRRGQRLSP